MKAIDDTVDFTNPYPAFRRKLVNNADTGGERFGLLYIAKTAAGRLLVGWDSDASMASAGIRYIGGS